MLAPNSKFETPPLLLTWPGSSAITGYPPLLVLVVLVGGDPPLLVLVGGYPPELVDVGGGSGPVGFLPPSGPVGFLSGPVGGLSIRGPVFFLVGPPYSGRRAH